MSSIVITVHNGSTSKDALVKSWNKLEEGREFKANGEQVIGPGASADFIVDDLRSIEVVPQPAQNVEGA